MSNKTALKNVLLKTNKASGLYITKSRVYKSIVENGMLITFPTFQDYMIYLGERDLVQSSQD